MSGSERQRELRRRRKRSKQMKVVRRKMEKANASEKLVLVNKIKRMTPGAKDILPSLGITE